MVAAGRRVRRRSNRIPLRQRTNNWPKSAPRIAARWPRPMLFAINGHENRVSYIVGTGHRYRVIERRGQKMSPTLVREATRALGGVSQNQQVAPAATGDRAAKGSRRRSLSAAVSRAGRGRPGSVRRAGTGVDVRSRGEAIRPPALESRPIPATSKTSWDTTSTDAGSTPPKFSIVRPTSTPT